MSVYLFYLIGFTIFVISLFLAYLRGYKACMTDYHNEMNEYLSYCDSKIKDCESGLDDLIKQINEHKLK